MTPLGLLIFLVFVSDGYPISVLRAFFFFFFFNRFVALRRTASRVRIIIRHGIGWRGRSKTRKPFEKTSFVEGG